MGEGEQSSRLPTVVGSLRNSREVEDPLRKVDSKDMGSAAMTEGSLYFGAALQRNPVDGHPTCQDCLSISEVEQTGRFVSRAREYTPPLPPVLQTHTHSS